MTDAETAVVLDLVVGLVVTGLVVASYIPQHIQCLRHCTAEGLSLWTVLISTVSGVALALASVLGDWNDVAQAIAVAAATATSTSSNSINNSIIAADVPTLPLAPLPLESLDAVLQVVNVALPMLQSLLMVCVGTPSYILYFFRFGSSTATGTTNAPLSSNDASTEPIMLGSAAAATTGTSMRVILNGHTTSTNGSSNGDIGAIEIAPLEVLERQVRLSHPLELSTNTSTASGKHQRRHDAVAALLTWTIMLVSTVASIAALATFGSHSIVVTTLVKIWGATATLTNCVQWMPQIYTTWQAQHEGIVSIASLVFSVVGDVLLGLSWIQSNDVSPWVCMTLVADASMQLVLIGIIVHFRRQRRRQLVSFIQQSTSLLLADQQEDHAPPLPSRPRSLQHESQSSTPLLSALHNGTNGSSSSSSHSNKRLHLDIEPVGDKNDDMVNEKASDSSLLLLPVD